MSERGISLNMYNHDQRESGSERPFSFASFLFLRGCVQQARLLQFSGAPDPRSGAPKSTRTRLAVCRSGTHRRQQWRPHSVGRVHTLRVGHGTQPHEKIADFHGAR